MKLFIVVIFFFSGCFISCNSQKTMIIEGAGLKFLFKASLDTLHESRGQYIKIKQILPDTDDLLPMSIDDRDIIERSQYSRDEQIGILGEYLSFRGDTIASNKRYHFKAASHMIKPEDINGFTIQIEALYSFTRMLMVGYPPIKPMLINCSTGEELNMNPKVVSEVYDIYVKWYNENKKTDFKNISLPLTGSPYCWLGEEKGMEPYLKKSF